MINENQKVGDLGQHWTPRDVVQTMVKLKKNKGLTLEPSAGSGRFVEVLPDCIAIEIDASVVPDNLKHQYLISNFFDVDEDQKFDTVIGNPPYVAGKLLTPDWFNNWTGVLPRTANAYLHIIDKCINHLNDKGEIIFIVPSSLFSDSSRGKELRKKMLSLGAFTDVIFCHEQVEWENAAVDTLIFRWQKGLKQKKVKTNLGDKILFESNGFTWLIDFIPAGTMGEWFKATVGSAPLRAAVEAKRGGEYIKEGKIVLIEETECDKWPRVHHTPVGDKLFYVGGPIRRWPVFFSGTSGKHLDNALLPKHKIDIVMGAALLNEWFKANGEALSLIKGGRWICGVKQFENCPITEEMKEALSALLE